MLVRGRFSREKNVTTGRFNLSSAPMCRTFPMRAARELPEAARCYEAVIELDRRSPIALRALREIYEDLGEREKAIAATISPMTARV